MGLKLRSKLSLILALFFYATKSKGQDLLYFAKVDYYECKKNIAIKIRFINNSKSNIYVDTCIAPNYTTGGYFKFDFNIIDASDTLSSIHPAPLLRPIDLTSNNSKNCFVLLRPKESITTHINLIKAFNWDAVKKIDTYTAIVSFRTSYLKDQKIRQGYFTRKILESSNNKCFIRIL